MRLKWPLVFRNTFEILSISKFQYVMRVMDLEGKLKRADKRIEELEREVNLARGSAWSASQSTAELISRLQWTDHQLCEMEKSVQFGDQN